MVFGVRTVWCQRCLVVVGVMMFRVMVMLLVVVSKGVFEDSL